MSDSKITEDPALSAAVRLHDFIRSNAGATADWPLQITSDDPGALEKLDMLLRDFRTAMTAMPNTQTQPRHE